jgi:hypothetical protein
LHADNPACNRHVSALRDELKASVIPQTRHSPLQ